MAKTDRGLRAHLTKRLRTVITGLSPQGRGLAELELGSKKVWVQVDDALPGEELEVELCKVLGRQLLGVVRERFSSPLSKKAPRCAHASARIDKDTGCGGCSLQAISYPEQLALKQEMLSTIFGAVQLHDLPLAPITGAQNQWNYRNKMELSFGPDGADALGLGMHPNGFKHEVVSLRTCYLMDERLAPLAQALIAWAQSLGLAYYVFRKNEGFLRLLSMREGKRTGERMLILTTTGDAQVHTNQGDLPATQIVGLFAEMILAKAQSLSLPLSSIIWTQHFVKEGERTRFVDHTLYGTAIIQECLHLPDAEHALYFEILPRAFFQPNTLQAEVLYTLIRQMAAPLLHANSLILDLYCGTGTIALSFAMHGYRAIGIDIERQAIENARQNAQKNGITHAEFFVGDAGAVLKELMAVRHFDDFLLIIDPPRRGLLPPTYKQILTLRPQHIIYISCNPETLAADLAQFRADNYQIIALQPIDMLPQTAHIECIALLHSSPAPVTQAVE